MSDPNTDSIARGVSFLSFLAAVISLAGIGWIIYDSQQRHQESQAAIAALSEDLAASRKEVADLRKSMDELEALTGQLFESTQDSMARAAVIDRERLDASSLPDGLYTLTKTVELRYPRRSGTYTEKFNIVHAKQSYGEINDRKSVNIGFAYVLGFRAPQFYLDFNGDNAIDVKVMHDVVHALPMGSHLSQTLKEFNSQVIYNTFLRNYAEADYTSIKDVDKKAEGTARALWKVVNDTLIPSWLSH